MNIWTLTALLACGSLYLDLLSLKKKVSKLEEDLRLTYDFVVDDNNESEEL